MDEMVRRAEFESATSSVSTRRSNRAELTAQTLAATKVDSDSNPFQTDANQDWGLPCQGAVLGILAYTAACKSLKIPFSFESGVSQKRAIRQSLRQIETVTAVPTGSGVYGTDRLNGCLWTGADGAGVIARESHRSSRREVLPALVIEFQPAAFMGIVQPNWTRAAIDNCGDGWRKSVPAQTPISDVQPAASYAAARDTCWAELGAQRQAHSVTAAVSAVRYNPNHKVAIGLSALGFATCNTCGSIREERCHICRRTDL